MHVEKQVDALKGGDAMLSYTSKPMVRSRNKREASTNKAAVPSPPYNHAHAAPNRVPPAQLVVDIRYSYMFGPPSESRKLREKKTRERGEREEIARLH
jgi:hypothetical protein